MNSKPLVGRLTFFFGDVVTTEQAKEGAPSTKIRMYGSYSLPTTIERRDDGMVDRCGDIGSAVIPLHKTTKKAPCRAVA